LNNFVIEKDPKLTRQSNLLRKIAIIFFILELVLLLPFLWYVRFGNAGAYMKLVIAAAICLIIGIILSKISSDKNQKNPIRIAIDTLVLFIIATVIAFFIFIYLSKTGWLNF